MDAINTAKIVLAIITIIIAFFCTYFQLKKNKTFLLNKIFAFFMILVSLGFISYITYHFIYDNVSLVIALNILTNVFYNFAFACLAITPFIIIYSEKNIIVQRISIVIYGLCILTLLGYFIWPVTVDMEKYAQGSVSSSSPLPHMLILTLYKLIIIIFVLYEYIKVAKHTEGAIEQKMKCFSWAMISIIIGTVIITISSAFGTSADYLKVVGGIFLNLAIILFTIALVPRSEELKK